MKRVLSSICRFLVYRYSILIVQIFYKDIWTLREKEKQKSSLFKKMLYYAYLDNYGAWIGIDAEIKGALILPHGLCGIFISQNAVIGYNVTIFQHVTIGANNIANSKNYGSPTIKDNVYIGAGAKIIGRVAVGNNVRIGANCVVVKDVPDNSVAVLPASIIIRKEYPLDNTIVKRHTPSVTT